MASSTFRNSTLFKQSNLKKTDLACNSYLTLRRRKAIMRAISPKAALMTVSRCAGRLWTYEGCTLSHSWLSSTNTVDVTQTEWRKPHFQVKMFCCLWSLQTAKHRKQLLYLFVFYLWYCCWELLHMKGSQKELNHNWRTSKYLLQYKWQFWCRFIFLFIWIIISYQIVWKVFQCFCQL